MSENELLSRNDENKKSETMVRSVWNRASWQYMLCVENKWPPRKRKHVNVDFHEKMFCLDYMSNRDPTRYYFHGVKGWVYQPRCVLRQGLYWCIHSQREKCIAHVLRTSTSLGLHTYCQSLVSVGRFSDNLWGRWQAQKCVVTYPPVGVSANIYMRLEISESDLQPRSAFRGCRMVDANIRESWEF